MHIELGNEDAAALREFLQEQITTLDKEINRADSLRFKQQLKDTEHRLERVLGAIAQALDGAPDSWEARDNVSDVDRAAPAPKP